MTKIEAIVRKSKCDEVSKALCEADADFLSWWNIRGHGSVKHGLVFRGIYYDLNSVDRIYIMLVIHDINVQKSVDAILKSAYTGESGDGRIIITNIDQSVHIRTKSIDCEVFHNKKHNKYTINLLGKEKQYEKEIH